MQMELSNDEIKIKKLRLTLSLYLNYFVHGFGLIILAQNMVALSQDWGTPLKVVSFVISGIGIGRLIAYLITGPLADALSRKLFIYIGMLSYLTFALGMVMHPNLIVAYGLAILAGIANSALDAGTYTTLVEMNNGKGHGTVLIKAFMSLGEFVLPLIIATIQQQAWWYGWSFIVMAAVIIVNLILIAPLKFPQPNQVASAQREFAQAESKTKRNLQTGLLLVYGYTSMALMIWFTQWISLYAKESLNLGITQSQLMMSLYSVGSITGVLVLFFLLQKVKRKLNLMLALNGGALLALVALLLIPNLLAIQVASLLFGFCAAGGVMQTGLTVFMDLFPKHRGLVTGIYYFFGSIASFTVPLITGLLSDQGIATAFRGDLVIAAVGLVIVGLLRLTARKEG